MKSMAQAWDRENATMVSVISVYGGEWLVQNQGTDETRTLSTPDELVGLWIDSEIVDTFDEFVDAFGVTDAYLMVAAISKHSAWAQAIAQQWATLY